MSSDDLSANLRLLCSYGRSVSEICRQAGINRHQLQRYLNGATSPSLHTLRRLCDFFGLEEHEILLSHADLAALVRIRPPRLQRSRDRAAEYMGVFFDSQDLDIAANYVGYYHIYFQPNRLVPEIHRAITRVMLEDRCLVTRTLERYPAGSPGLPRVVKYDGIAYTSGSTFTVIERRPSMPSSTFFTVLYGADAGELTYLSGLVTGVAPDSSRTIYSLRTCWQYLGRDIELRKEVNACGQFPARSRSIGKNVRQYTDNNLADGDEAFSPHF
jgi:transcriptional regulator with XRE-family HTH domain